MRRLSTLALAILSCACAKPSLAQAHTNAPAAKPSVPRTDELTVEAMVDLEWVSDATVSPDGKTIAYVLRVPPDDLDGPTAMRSEIWVIPARGDKAKARSYTTPSASSHSPAWSPDGKRIAFMSRRPGSTKSPVFAGPSDGGAAAPLTDSETEIHAFAWSPDGKQLAYVADQEPSPEEEQDKNAGRDQMLGDVEGTFQRLHVLDLRSKQAKAVSPRDRYVSQIAWSPDGKRLAVQASDRADVDATMMYSRLYTISVEGSVEGSAEGGELQPLCETAGKLGHIDWSPVGQHVAFLGATDLHDSTAAGRAPSRSTTRAPASGSSGWARTRCS